MVLYLVSILLNRTVFVIGFKKRTSMIVPSEFEIQNDGSQDKKSIIIIKNLEGLTIVVSMQNCPI